MKKHILLTLICLVFYKVEVNAQKKLIDKLTSNTKDTTRSSTFLPLPAIGYAQEKGWEFGLAVIYSFYTDKKDTLIRNSTINAVASITTKNQSNYNIKGDIWTQGNKYHYVTELRYKNFPFNFYGIGSNTSRINENKLDQQLIRLLGEIEKRITKSYYAGINSSFEHYRFTDKAEGGIFENELFRGKEGGKVWFTGISQIFDTRNTNTFTTNGHYFKVNYSYAPDFFGDDNFTGSLFKVDLRTFKSLKPNLVLGFNVVYNTLQGKQAPFFLLPQLGHDQIMRGYYPGRYREENLLAAQTELRYRFMPRLGVAAFIGGGNVFANGDPFENGIKPSYGGGMRYFFDVEKGLSVRFDYGIGEKRPAEKRQTGFYISFGEAF